MTARALRALLDGVPDDADIIAMIDGYQSIVDALMVPGAVLLGSTPITEVLDGDTGRLMDPVEGHMAALATVQKNKNTARIRGDH